MPAPLLDTAHRVEALVAANGWDQPPRLFGIVPTFDALEVPDFHQLVTPDGRPVAGLHYLAGLGRHLQYKVPRQLWPLRGLVGWVLVHEAWMVLTKPEADPVGTAGALAAAVGRQLHAHPDRLEVRGVHLAGRDGTTESLFRRRDGGELLTLTEWLGEDGQATGDVVEALATLMAGTPPG